MVYFDSGKQKSSAYFSGFEHKKVNETEISFLEGRKTEIVHTIVTDRPRQPLKSDVPGGARGEMGADHFDRRMKYSMHYLVHFGNRQVKKT